MIDKRDRKVLIVCEHNASDKCKRSHRISIRAIQKNLSRNEQYICFFCSRTIKYMGRNNPNCKYLLDDDFFKEIDTEDKAYLLGWIASDGHVAKSGCITVSIRPKDGIDILPKLRDMVCKEIPIKSVKSGEMMSISFCSKTMTEDVCRWLDIRPGKKSYTVGFPALGKDHLKWAFIRGYFDGDGHVRKRTQNKRTPGCGITSNSRRMLDSLSEFISIPSNRSKDRLDWSGVNALDFMGKIYSSSSLHLKRKFDIYEDWCGWVPSLPGYWRREHFTFTRTRKDAIAPVKKRISDSGYDLTILESVKSWGNVTLFDTGIKVKPNFGCYFDLVARSSLIKTGYILANGIGIIDQSYLGNIMVALMKVDSSRPDLELPLRVAQLIPRQTCHAEFIEVESLDETDRASGGFGSTGTK